MVLVQVIGNRPAVGKTCLIAALLNGLGEDGKTCCYYKPFSRTPDHDLDTEFISQQLLPESGPLAQPRAYPDNLASPATPALAKGAQETISKLVEKHDVVMVEGPDLASETGGSLPLDANYLSELAPKMVLVYRYEAGLEASTIAAAAQSLGSNLAGVVINGFLRHRQRAVCEGLVSDLKAAGIPILGALPEDRTMLAVTVHQVAEHLGGRWLRPPADPEVWVDRFLIGGNIMDSGATYFGRYCHQAVITRAERPDIQMASLACDTQCLVLTGGSEPIEYVQVEASKKDVPIILVEGNTLSTVDSLAGILDRAKPHARHKVQRFSELMENYLDQPALRRLLNQ